MHRDATLGLELGDGVQVVLQAVGRDITARDVDRSLAVIRERIDRLGLSEHDVRRLGRDRIVVQLADAGDAGDAARFLGTTARLDVYDVEPNLLEGPRSNVYELLAAQRSRPAGAWYLFDPTHRVVAGPKPTREALLSSSRGRALRGASGRLPPGFRVLAAPAATAVLACRPGNLCRSLAGGRAERTLFYLFRHDPDAGVPELTLSDLRQRGLGAESAGSGGRPVVILELTPADGERFRMLTAAESSRGRARGRPQHYAIVLDGEIKGFSVIDYARYPNGIPGSVVEISGMDDPADVARLGVALRTGPLPVRFIQVSRTPVSAALGRDTLGDARWAALAGGAAGALVLLLLYRLAGAAVLLALVIWGAFVYGFVLVSGVTLTLAGFAGLVPAAALAADAGSTRRSGAGAMLHAHVLTAATAFVVFAVATGAVQDFALMLLVGTGAALLAAAPSRALLVRLRRDVHSAQRIDVMRRRTVPLAVSALLVAAAAVTLGVRGLELGIDLDGGSQVAFTTAEPRSVGDVRRAVGAVQPDAIVQSLGATSGDRHRFWQVRTPALAAERQAALRDELRERHGSRAVGITAISASSTRQLAWRALIALIAALVLAGAYLVWRLGHKYAVVVLAVLIHSVMIVLGAYALTQRPVTSAAVAAVLAAALYALYVTVAVLARVRENFARMRSAPAAAIANASAQQTVRRVLTSASLLVLPAAALPAFGGAALRDLALGLGVGVAAGAYGSIFLAIPLLAMWKAREPRPSQPTSANGYGGDRKKSAEAVIAVVRAGTSPPSG